ncbi:MAG: phenylalanine--tRNA ligase subunit beta [Acidobacteriota bacterium]|nr:phenylalanine--tRNA ligase subunit beta [Acidobacteriota bacterium]
MRVLVSWLRELVEIPVGIDQLSEALTMRGFEVGAIEPWSTPDHEPDAVLDLEITTNRPDCLSILGIAREVGAIYDADLKLPFGFTIPESSMTPTALTVSIDDPALCPRYVGALAGVTVGASPAWLARRLEAAEIRPINNVVDVTNYVMLELGHPMHAIDLERLSGGEINVRRARADETIRTLDGVERSLSPDMLVIADAERAQAVAGIMGGADSEVTDATRTIVLEAAYFNPISVRRTRRRLGLSTDASYRFERGADIAAPPAAVTRAWQILADIDVGTPTGPLVDTFPAPASPIEVRLRHARIGHLLGQQIDEQFVAPTLTRLGFDPRPEPGVPGTTWLVRVPTFRVDVSREEDLIEEVARHHGYDVLPTTFPALTQPPPTSAAWRTRDRLIRRLLTGSGFSEAITYGFIERAAALAIHGDASNLVALRNPLSEKGAVLRPSLLPGLIGSLIHNRRRERQDIRLFELGSRFQQSTGETTGLALAMTGAAIPPHWSRKARKTDLFDLTGLIDRICAGFGQQAVFEPSTASHLVSGQTAAVSLAADSNRSRLGVVGQLEPELAAARGLTGSDAVYVAELDIERLTLEVFDHLRATPVPRHPSVTRDLSIEVDDTLPAARVRDTIQAAAGPSLIDVVEVDRYTGSGVASGSVSVSMRLTFRAPDRTLTDTEVQAATDTAMHALVQNHRAKQR